MPSFIVEESFTKASIGGILIDIYNNGVKVGDAYKTYPYIPTKKDVKILLETMNELLDETVSNYSKVEFETKIIADFGKHINELVKRGAYGNN